MNSASMCRAGVVLVNILGLFLAACGPTSAAAQSNSRPCTLATPGANVYRLGMHQQVRNIYARWVQNPGSINPSIKDEAFSLLVDQVKRWTTATDVPYNNINVIRITLTYISPELAQIIILNHQLYKGLISEIEFENMLITKMNEIARREELIFLMTITYSQYDNLIPEVDRVMMTIPMNGIVLTNSENMQVIAHSVDPHLRQEIVISHGPSAGYVAFPIGVGTSENCLEVLDRNLNTEINVSTRGLRINGLDYAPQLSWFVKYHPLVEMDDGIISPSVRYTAPSGIPINHLPPGPTMPAAGIDEYWKQMALHVWGYVTDP